MVIKLVLVRHGESQWNKENRFTGWTDVDLSETGLTEAQEAGKVLRQQGFEFDIAFTSTLKRAIRTLWSCLDELDQMWLPTVKAWQLNERHYGSLQGLNKAETAAKHGEDQVKIWRRSFDIPPPALEKSDERWPGNHKAYKNVEESNLPLTESLKDTIARFLPYWHGVIEPEVKSGRKVLIVAHGNSLRGLIKHLDNVSDQDIIDLNLPTGVPLVYELDENLKPIKHYYLGDEEKIKAAQESVANQGKAK